MVSSVIPTSAPEINLTSTRFSNISAKIGEKNDAAGGTLKVGINAELKKDTKAKRATGSVKFTVSGIPRGVTAKEIYAFRIELTVEGLFEWPGHEPDLTDTSFKYSLLQNLYVIGTLEVAALAQKMGFVNIELPMDIKLARSKAANPSTPLKPMKKAAAIKPTAVRSKLKKL